MPNNVAEALRSQANRGEHPTKTVPRRRAVNEREVDVPTAEVLARMVISPPRPSLVEIYEPRQTPEQEEVILEQFPMEGGAIETREMRSATAAFRFKPLTTEQFDALEKDRLKRSARLDADPRSAEALTIGQPGTFMPGTKDEMRAGSARQDELARAEGEPHGTPTKRRASGGTIEGGTAPAETEGSTEADPQPQKRKRRTKEEMAEAKAAAKEEARLERERRKAERDALKAEKKASKKSRK
jgi:hypothetical protein